MTDGHRVIALSIACMALHAALAGAADDDAGKPLSSAERAALRGDLEKRLARLDREIESRPRDVGAYGFRGDAHFFLGRFEKAVADYDRMVELDPRVERSHWRRGIAYFYAGRYRDAARQFEIYHTHDDVDRENGIWRYLSQRRAHGLERARKGLLKYRKTDREPFGDVYALFAGKITPARILERVEGAEIDDDERSKRLFYAHLYIGLEAAVEGRDDEALRHLGRAVANPWPRRAGFGPRYMWHVGRLHHDRLVAARREAAKEKKKPVDSR